MTLSSNDLLSLELRHPGCDDTRALLSALRAADAEVRRLRRRLEDAEQAVRDAATDLGTQGDRLAAAFRDGLDSAAETPAWWEWPEYVLPLRGRRAEVDLTSGAWRVVGAGAYVPR